MTIEQRYAALDAERRDPRNAAGARSPRSAGAQREPAGYGVVTTRDPSGVAAGSIDPHATYGDP